MLLPWRQVPVAHQAREKGNGRAERRALKVATVAAGLAFPHAAQAIQIVRRLRPLTGKSSKKWSTQTVYAVTSLTAIPAGPPTSPASSAATGLSRTGCTGSVLRGFPELLHDVAWGDTRDGFYH